MLRSPLNCHHNLGWWNLDTAVFLVSTLIILVWRGILLRHNTVPKFKIPPFRFLTRMTGSPLGRHRLWRYSNTFENLGKHPPWCLESFNERNSLETLFKGLCGPTYWPTSNSEHLLNSTVLDSGAILKKAWGHMSGMLSPYRIISISLPEICSMPSFSWAAPVHEDWAAIYTRYIDSNLLPFYSKRIPSQTVSICLWSSGVAFSHVSSGMYISSPHLVDVPLPNAGMNSPQCIQRSLQTKFRDGFDAIFLLSAPLKHHPYRHFPSESVMLSFRCYRRCHRH